MTPRSWIPVGTTPTPPVRIPSNAWFYRYTKPGYRTVTVMGARLGGSYVPIPSPGAAAPRHRSRLRHGAAARRTSDGDAVRAGGRDTFELADFLMDKLEITNRQYKAFVDAGGYTNRDVVGFDDRARRKSRSPWEAAMALFVDRTGRPGPSSWEGGAPPTAPRTSRWAA